MSSDKEQCFKCLKWFYYEDLFDFDNSGYPFCKDCVEELKKGKVKINR